MARIRSIKPEFRTSEKVNSWPRDVRLFWVLLWGYCDDFGRGKDNPRLIVADAFPLDDDVDADTIERWMQTLAADRVIERYEVAGARYFAVTSWGEHQKLSHPSKSVTPCRHGHVIQAVCGEAPECLRSDSGEPLDIVGVTSGDTPPRAGKGSGDLEGEASAPQRTCVKHPEGSDDPCGACKEARLRFEEWERAEMRKPSGPPTLTSLKAKCAAEGHVNAIAPEWCDRCGERMPDIGARAA